MTCEVKKTIHPRFQSSLHPFAFTSQIGMETSDVVHLIHFLALARVLQRTRTLLHILLNHNTCPKRLWSVHAHLIEVIPPPKRSPSEACAESLQFWL